MKKLFFLVLLTPLVQAKWIDEYNYKIDSLRLDGNTKFDKYCIDGTVFLVANRGVNQIGLIQVMDTVKNGVAESCGGINKDVLEKRYKD